jgi:hypothetical protein
MPEPLSAAAIGGIVSGVGSLIGGIFGGGRARKRARAAAREKKRLEGKLDALEKNRQAIINPYEGVKDVSSMAEDLSSMASNTYANLGVATQAAEMQIEEADIALANTLDTLRATGSGAGGATALAQAALQSKKGVSASIEQQEIANEKLKAQGEQELQRVKMSEAQRMQQAQVAGKQFVFGQKEAREMQQLNRVSAQISGAQQQQVAAQQAGTSMMGATIGALGSIGGAFAGAS